MQLAKDETVVKEWVYGKSKQGREITTAKLTLTTERLISLSESKNKKLSSEIPLGSIRGLSFSTAAASNVVPILKIVLGIFLSFAIIGIPLLINGVRSLNRAAFAMDVSIAGTPEFVAGADTGNRKMSRHKLRVKVYKDAIDEISDSIGAAILERKTAKEGAL